MDKLIHFSVASIIAFGVANSLSNIVPLWILFLGTSAAFLLFEIYQKVFKKGQFEWLDWFVGTLAAGLIFGTAYIQSC